MRFARGPSSLTPFEMGPLPLPNLQVLREATSLRPYDQGDASFRDCPSRLGGLASAGQASLPLTWRFWGILSFNFLLVQDLFEQVRNGRRIRRDQLSGQTFDSAPISGQIRCFWSGLNMRPGSKLGWRPQTDMLIRNFFVGPVPELAFERA